MRKRVLVVEDDISNQIFYKKFLEKDGWEVDCVDNVKDALLSLESNIYELYIVDIRLRDGVNGNALVSASHLRPMIVITALSLEDMTSVEYLQKPIEAETLKRIIKKVTGT